MLCGFARTMVRLSYSKPPKPPLKLLGGLQLAACRIKSLGAGTQGHCNSHATQRTLRRLAPICTLLYTTVLNPWQAVVPYK
jgi:hypothetical protein